MSVKYCDAYFRVWQLKYYRGFVVGLSLNLVFFLDVLNQII